MTQLLFVDRWSLISSCVCLCECVCWLTLIAAEDAKWPPRTKRSMRWLKRMDPSLQWRVTEWRHLLMSNNTNKRCSEFPDSSIDYLKGALSDFWPLWTKERETKTNPATGSFDEVVFVSSILWFYLRLWSPPPAAAAECFTVFTSESLTASTVLYRA